MIIQPIAIQFFQAGAEIEVIFSLLTQKAFKVLSTIFLLILFIFILRSFLHFVSPEEILISAITFFVVILVFVGVER